MLSTIITETINLKSKDDNDNNVLQQAVINNNVEFVALILEKLENDSNKNDIINSRNKNGETAFFIAVKNENNILAEMLDLTGADKTIRNNNGEYIINTNNSDNEDNIIISDNEQIVDFKFPIVKCKNNVENNDVADALFKLNGLNKLNSLPINITENDTESINNPIVDIEYLNRLMDQYLILKHIKNQDGGSTKKKIIYGSRKI
jgi:ankyrin repeat protein